MTPTEVVLKGTLPLLVNSQQGMNRQNEDARRLTMLNASRGKTDDAYNQISDLEMKLALYWDHERDVAVFPAFNVQRAIQDGGKMGKKGKKITQGIRIVPDCIDFEIRYPKRLDFEHMLVSPLHRDIRTVKVGQATVTRTRARFDEWTMEGLFYRDVILELDELIEAGTKGGLYYGLGDFRVGTPKGGRYGTFTFTARDLSLEESEAWIEKWHRRAKHA